MISGWKIEPECRERLLELFVPKYRRVVADHVTRSMRDRPDAPLPPVINNARIVGYLDDGVGLEALVVAIDGSTQRLGDGTWHITWSLAEGRTPKETNEVLAERGWVPREGGPIRLTPAVW